MLYIKVGLTLPDKTVLNCGEIVATEPDQQGIIQGAFRYTPEFLKHPKSFPLDPVELPLEIKEFSVHRKEGIHAVFEDALPDDWGRRLITRHAQLPRQEQTLPRLLGVLRPNGLGALSFEQQGIPVDKKTTAETIDLFQLLEIAYEFDAGMPIGENQLKLLFAHGSSPGGARPKVTIRKKDDTLWLAKFPRQSDKFQIESLEAGCLEMALNCGLPVPDFNLKSVGKRKALLVKRFDISDKGGRYHMISMQTLLQAEGYYNMGYHDLFEILRKYSYQPSVDIPVLFRQMVFNCAVGNTDDHLKNFCMLHKEPGFCLSPVYDIIPDVSDKREHTLLFPMGSGTLPPNRDVLIIIGKKLGISKPEEIINSVLNAVLNWRAVFKQYKVPDSDIERLAWSIERRLERLKETK